jgi:hypothetical protein
MAETCARPVRAEWDSDGHMTTPRRATMNQRLFSRSKAISEAAVGGGLAKLDEFARNVGRVLALLLGFVVSHGRCMTTIVDGK